MNQLQLARKKYVPYLPDFLSLCERNYAQLRFFLPRTERQGEQHLIHISASESYRVEVLERCKYTVTVRIELLKEQSKPWFHPQFEVRLYHDARMAEVLACQHVRQLRAVYSYPNVDMLLPDEKVQINLLLRDWLKLCARRGYQTTELLA
ncbi:MULTISPECIES: DUF1249 domain-containing protein [Rheinheimera]|uniref:DUF1249 domain-containing protein n=1 Tax=Rheinheimera marina TaxID=1774958 RepID=A0ABV9JPY3_9GAMM